jgi:uroporphyrinogen III methyltransferase/synthase
LKDAAIDFELHPPVELAADSWLTWLDERPLFGRRVAVLRMVGQASETGELLRSRGADPWVVPTIELHPPEDREALRDALRRLGDYDLVAFTSVNGVERAFEELGELGLDARAFGRSRVAAIGDGTARRLADRGIRADVVAKVFRGEGLAESILEWLGDARGKRVLVPRALEAREVLPEMLRQAGAQVDVVAAYRTLAPAPESLQSLVGALEAGRVDAVLLTSSSTVTNLCQALGEGYLRLLGRTCVASIGPITSARARELGLEVGVEAEKFTIAGLVDALERYFS